MQGEKDSIPNAPEQLDAFYTATWSLKTQTRLQEEQEDERTVERLNVA